MKDFLYVYYNNRLKAASDLIASPLANNSAIEDIYHHFLSRNVLFTSSTVTITATFGVNNFIDAIGLCGCAFTQADILVKGQGDMVLFMGTMY